MLRVFNSAVKMSKSGMNPETVRLLKNLESKISVIRNETRTFMQKKDEELSQIQNQIKDILGEKRPLCEASENGHFVKKFKTEYKEEEDVKPNLSDRGFRVDEGYVQVYTDGACPANGKPGAKAGQ